MEPPYNKQYYPRIFSQGKNAIAHTSTAIANAAEVNMGFGDLVFLKTQTIRSNTGSKWRFTPFYQIDTNPLIARISTTEKGIGATYWNTWCSTSKDLGTAICSHT